VSQVRSLRGPTSGRLGKPDQAVDAPRLSAAVYFSVMNWPLRRRALLDAQARLEERHAALVAPQVSAGRSGSGQAPRPGSGQAPRLDSGQAAGPQLHELREHHEDLQEHHTALADYQSALDDLSPTERDALSLGKALTSAEVMLLEAGRAVDEAREAWRRATDVYKKVRDILDREE
jgi:tetratricopeptide (TPR) repeat protein